MTIQPSSQPSSPDEYDNALKRVAISGFSSYKQMQSVRIFPLTILAGANSGGKSSSIKPLLLLKQTLDSTTDPGPLQIWGPNVQYERISQILTKLSTTSSMDTITIDLDMQFGCLRLEFSRISDYRIGVKKVQYELSYKLSSWAHKLEIDPRMSSVEIEMQLPEYTRAHVSKLSTTLTPSPEHTSGEHGAPPSFLTDPIWTVRQERCFPHIVYTSPAMDYHKIDLSSQPAANFSKALKSILHVSSERKILGRIHQALEVQSVESGLPGLFENYTASIIENWQQSSDLRLDRLKESLRELELTSDVFAFRRGDAALELYVARPQSVEPTVVSLADVGLGVSHALPVLVALESAGPGQMVYIEHPESHLHPRATRGLAKALVRAARRGVHVVAETHSSLLLLHIQAQIARAELDPKKVGLHWFSLDHGGFTDVSFVQPDSDGRTGNWPEDFADTEMDATSEYLRAVRRR